MDATRGRVLARLAFSDRDRDAARRSQPRLFVAMPIAFVAVIAGAIVLITTKDAAAGRTAHLAAAVALPCLLLVVALAGNVNHGATPGPSRTASGSFRCWRPRWPSRSVRWTDAAACAMRWGFVLILALGWSRYSFHPKRLEQRSEPTTFARWLWQRHPAVDNPLPEVFAERLSGFDGLVVFPGRRSIAARRCFSRGPRLASAGGRSRVRGAIHRRAASTDRASATRTSRGAGMRLRRRRRSPGCRCCRAVHGRAMPRVTPFASSSPPCCRCADRRPPRSWRFPHPVERRSLVDVRRADEQCAGGLGRSRSGRRRAPHCSSPCRHRRGSG